MGAIGGTSEFKNMDLSILNSQHVILIPEFNKASLLAMEGLAKHLENHCDSEVRIYPHPMLVARNDTPESTEGWQQLEMKQAWFLDESENPSVFIKKTVMEQAMTLPEYKDFLVNLNLLASEKKAKSYEEERHRKDEKDRQEDIYAQIKPKHQGKGVAYRALRYCNRQ